VTAPTSPIIDTHTLDFDPPHDLTAVSRWTCTSCGRAVLVNGPVVYGSASTEECASQR
jgi:hypothetical protein